MTSAFHSFGIIGAGAWGTALATASQRAGYATLLWARDPRLADQLRTERENRRYLPGVRLDPALHFTHELAALAACGALIVAVPAQHLRAACRSLAGIGLDSQPLIIACKGIELGTQLLMGDVARQESPARPVFILTGPSFAREIAVGLPAALTLAGPEGREELAAALSSPRLRIYTTEDMIGAQIGGAVKNVLAIACGIVAGRRLGDNARAALITRGLAEIMRLGAALGGCAETFMGLSGLGDIVLTCSSPQSRNMALGIGLGEGRLLADLLASAPGVVEGIATTTAVLDLARSKGIDMPVARAVDAILRGNTDIDDQIAGLLARPLREEVA